jgi:hypothetical protein
VESVLRPGGLRTGVLTTDGQHDVWRALWTYCTSLFGDGEPPEYRGSGTFINVRGVSCLLTAAHVWEGMSRDEGVGFTLEPDRPLAWVPKVVLLERFVSHRLSKEWGPDIAVVSFHDSDAKRL